METLVTIFIEKLGLEKYHFEKLSYEMCTKIVKKKEHLIIKGSVCTFIEVLTSGILRSYIRNNDEEFNKDFYLEE